MKLTFTGLGPVPILGAQRSRVVHFSVCVSPEDEAVTVMSDRCVNFRCVNRLIWKMRLGALILASAGACGHGDDTPASKGAAPRTADSSGVPSSLRERQRTGPLLIVDSSAREPSVEIRGTDYVLHLPSEMARVLYDSLPGFTLLPQSNYPVDVVSTHDSPLSIVVGDFNGDSVRDVAMIGESEHTPSFIFLLGKSDRIAEPRVVSILRPVPNSPTDLRSYYIQSVVPQRIAYPGSPETILDLKTDAIHAVSENVSTIYYLDHGQVRTFSVGGD